MPELNILPFPGPAAAKPLIIAHGLFGSARNWTAIARKLSQDRTVLVCDLRNHGDSFHDDDHSYPALAADLAQVLRDLPSPAHLLGHSMGGKAAMVLALEFPMLLRSLIVADIAPVAYAHSHAETVAAMQRVDLTLTTRRSEADAQLAVSIADPDLRTFLLQSLVPGPDGARWKLNLSALSAGMDAITGFPSLQGEYTGPALFLRGSASAYVSPDHHDAIHRLFPTAEIRTISGANHWLHADRPQEFCAEVSRFLAPLG